MPDKLTCEVYNKTRLAVRGDRTLYNDIVKKIGGRWNSRMHGGEGWIIHIEQKKVVEDLINSLNDPSDSKTTCKEKEEDNDFNTHEDSDEEDNEEEDNDFNTQQDSDEEEDNDEEFFEREKEEARKREKTREKEEAREREKKAREKEEAREREKKAREKEEAHEREKKAREKEEAHEREKKEKKAREKEEARKREKEETRKREKEETRKREKEAREKEEAHEREKEETRKREKEAREKEEAREREKEKRKDKIDKETRDIAEHAMLMESEDPLAYFRSFSKKPVDFRKLYGTSNSDSGSYSSSTTRSESSDDFPSPDTPIKNKSYKRSENNHNDLFEKVNELQRKLHELEIKNKKLKAKTGIFE